ncbi:MAG: hypothetical protein WC879_11265 [Melioribacteraceae bacterium]
MYAATLTAVDAQVISGRVIDGIDGKGVPGVNVKIVTTNPWTNYSVTSGPNGEFSFITDIEKENNTSINTTIDADVTSVSSRPYFTIQNNREQETNITIYSITGEKVRSINAPIMHGINNIQWDARNDNGETVSTGVYVGIINVGNTNIPRKFMIIKGDREGLPRNNIATKQTNNKLNKTNETIGVLKITDPQGIYTNSRDDFTCNGDTTINIIALTNKNTENQFPVNGQLIKTFNDITEYFIGTNIYPPTFNGTTKPSYPILVNTSTLPSSIKESVTQAMTSIDSLTGKDFTAEGIGNIEFFVVNNDTTNPLMTRNVYGEWTENDATGHPINGKIYINASHNLTSMELVAYVTKTLEKLILNTNKDSYNSKHSLYPKGLQKLSKDEVDLLNFQFNRRETTQYTETEKVLTDSINIIGTIIAPDTLTRTLRAVPNLIVHVDGKTDTTNAAGEYIFTNLNKGIKHMIIDSIMTNGIGNKYHQYEEDTTINTDQTLNKKMFPKINLIYNFGSINTTLDIFKYNEYAYQFPERVYTKPLYPIKVNIDSTNAPTGWITQTINAINDWNTQAKTELFKTNGTSGTIITIHYENNGPNIGRLDGTTKLTEFTNNIPTKFDVYINTGTGMNGTTDIFGVSAHELLRTIYGTRGQEYMSYRPEHIGYPERGPPDNITYDEAILAFIIKNIDANIRINNYK